MAELFFCSSDRLLSIAPSLELKRHKGAEVITTRNSINRTISGIETKQLELVNLRLESINRTISGIET